MDPNGDHSGLEWTSVAERPEEYIPTLWLDVPMQAPTTLQIHVLVGLYMRIYDAQGSHNAFLWQKSHKEVLPAFTSLEDAPPATPRREVRVVYRSPSKRVEASPHGAATPGRLPALALSRESSVIPPTDGDLATPLPRPKPRAVHRAGVAAASTQIELGTIPKTDTHTADEPRGVADIELHGEGDSAVHTISMIQLSEEAHGDGQLVGKNKDNKSNVRAVALTALHIEAETAVHGSEDASVSLLGSPEATKPEEVHPESPIMDVDVANTAQGSETASVVLPNSPSPTTSSEVDPHCGPAMGDTEPELNAPTSPNDDHPALKPAVDDSQTGPALTGLKRRTKPLQDTGASTSSSKRKAVPASSEATSAKRYVFIGMTKAEL